MDEELKLLRKELATLDHEFNLSIKNLQHRISTLESKQPLKIKEDATVSTAAPLDKEVVNSHNSLDTALDTNTKNSPSPSDHTHHATDQATPNEKQGWFSELVRQCFFALATPFLGPLSGLFEKIIGTYQHYKNQGKAPVFFMTITGVIALVLGFSYLLQYSFNTYLGEPAKVTLGFLAAIAITIGGVQFTKKRRDMAEYGSSLIALGVILNYLCAYFAGPYYNLLPNSVGFFLFAAVTVVAYVLALLFETRVVAIVTMVGGATIPWITGHIDTSPELYLSYLLMLVFAMLHLSQRIHWPPLAITAMIISAAMIQHSIYEKHLLLDQTFSLVAIIHGFYFVFSHYSLRGLSTASTMTNGKLMMISSNLMFFLYANQQLIPDSNVLGAIYLINILPWLLCVISPHKIFRYTYQSEPCKTVQSIALLQAGVLAGFGILLLSSPSMTGIIWCVEGLILIYLGSKFLFARVRMEGYIALLLSLLSMGYQVCLWLLEAKTQAPELLTLTIGSGWGNLIAISIFIYAAIVLLEKQNNLSETEHRITALLNNTLSISLLLSCLLTVGIFSSQAMWLFSIVPLFFLIVYGQKKRLFFIEIVGLCSYFLLLLPIIVGANIAGSFHFSEQSIYAKIARVEAFLCLWLMAEFYQRFVSDSPFLAFSEYLRKLFFCIIPVFFLPSILRHYSFYFPLALWLSSALALFLFTRLQLYVLQLEARLLVLIASASAIYSCYLVEFHQWQGHASAALCIGIIIYITIGWLGQGYRRFALGTKNAMARHQALAPLVTTGIYYIAITLTIISYGISGNAAFSLLLALLYLAGVFFYQPVWPPARRTLKLCYYSMFMLTALITLLHAKVAFFDSTSLAQSIFIALSNSISLAICAMLAYRPIAQCRAVWRVTGRQLFKLWWFNLIAIFAYISLLVQFLDAMSSPAISFALVAHGTIILLQSIQPRMKKLIYLSFVLYAVAALKVAFWDIQDFSLVQKVVVFMLVGLCMLAAAFKYQKMTTHTR